ncbi:hypothetical protein ODS41_04255 [Pyrobaculum sp. 3827-6]|uniref:hypothetical protein n=1 Tax=Pyrobaculum sp. 3827-6 TaxID=2983604 RepID=UPI0021D99057|nr:hypothetical protein [Pyrobaculum sp. 3827-6]MCU7787137.1 hypothetical protein [Pyrobaculum sp. 3827-6]
MDIKQLVATVASVATNTDLNTIYALVMLAVEELKLKLDVSITLVEEALRQLVEEGYLIEYEEATLDLSKRTRKYIATEKLSQVAGKPPPKTAQVAKMRYVTPTFYYLLNYAKK